MKRGLFTVAHPMFRPLWARLLAVGLMAGWAAFELWSGALVWAAVFGAAAAWLAYNFFLAFDPDDYQ